MASLLRRKKKMAKLDRGYGWMVVLSCFYGQLSCAGYFFSAGVFLPSWVHDFESSRGVTSWVVALCVATCNGAGPIIASLVARYGHRPVIIAGALLASLGVFLAAFATSVYLLMLFIGLMGGFGLGMLYLPSNSIIPYYFHRRRSLALGLVLCGTGLGNFIYPPFLAWLEGQIHWRGSLILVSGIMLQMVVFGALIRPVDAFNQETQEENSDSDSSNEEDVSTSAETEFVEMKNECTVEYIEKTSEYDESLKSFSYEGSNYTAPNQPRVFYLQYQDLKHDNYLSSEKRMWRQDTRNTSDYTKRKHLESDFPNCVTEEVRPFFTNQTKINWRDRDTRVIDEKERAPNVEASLKNTRNFYNDDSRIEELVSNAITRGQRIQELPDKEIPERSSDFLKKQVSLTPPESVTSISCCSSWLDHLRDTMLLMKNPHFAVFALSNFFTYLTFLMPPVYMADRAIENGVDKAEAALALSMYGAGNLFGRLGFGIMADNGCLDHLTLNAICLIICGASTCLSPLCGANVILHGLYGFTFGTFIGGMLILSPPFLLELLGVTKLNSSLGLIFMFRSI
ncbi:hypothetical protein EGW08_019296, partial [Elysia chlorotica]